MPRKRIDYGTRVIIKKVCKKSGTYFLRPCVVFKNKVNLMKKQSIDEKNKNNNLSLYKYIGESEKMKRDLEGMRNELKDLIKTNKSDIREEMNDKIKLSKEIIIEIKEGHEIMCNVIKNIIKTNEMGKNKELKDMEELEKYKKIMDDEKNV